MAVDQQCCHHCRCSQQYRPAGSKAHDINDSEMKIVALTLGPAYCNHGATLSKLELLLSVLRLLLSLAGYVDLVLDQVAALRLGSSSMHPRLSTPRQHMCSFTCPPSSRTTHLRILLLLHLLYDVSCLHGGFDNVFVTLIFLQSLRTMAAGWDRLNTQHVSTGWQLRGQTRQL